MIIRKVKVTEYEYQAPINYVAGATEPDIQFQLTDYEIPSGATGRVYVGRSDGTFEYTVATISGNNVTVAPTSSMFSVKGPGAIQVTLYVGNEVVKNFAVPVYVHADLADDSAEAGSDVTGVFRAAEEQALADFAEDAEAKAAEVIESIPADYTELTEEVDELNERLEQLEPGLSAEAKTALLACFAHVVWTDAHDQDYYGTLEDALNDEVILTSISAVYEASGHTVHQYDTLESLRPYVVVTANYSNGTSSVVSNYTMSGNLNSAISVITISFSGKTTQISVDVVIDSTLLYYAPSGYVLDGTNDTIIDTGVELSDTNQTITIVFDVTDDEVLTRARTAQLLYSYETLSNGVAGYNVALTGQASDDSFNKIYNAAVAGATSLKSPAQTNTTHRVKGALQYVSTSGEFNFTLYVDGATIYENYASSCNFKIGGTNAYIGGRGTGGFTWKGTIYLFNIYNRELTLLEIKELLGVA